jgi:hypothetical protein
MSQNVGQQGQAQTTPAPNTAPTTTKFVPAAGQKSLAGGVSTNARVTRNTTRNSKGSGPVAVVRKAK